MVDQQIYFAASGGRIKIGITADVLKRLNQIGAHLPGPIKLIGSIPGDRELEKLFHDRLRQHHLSGEWFRDCPSVRHVINDVLTRSGASIGSDAPEKVADQKQATRKITFRDLVRFASPHKPVRFLVECTGADASTCKRWLRGTSQPPASAAYRVFGDIFERLE